MKTSNKRNVSFSRSEFDALFGLYSLNVVNNLFRDYAVTHIGKGFFVSFHRDAKQPPLITFEKQSLGPDNYLYIASMTGAQGQVVEAVRSQKFDKFLKEVRDKIEILRQTHQNKPANVFALNR
ncbi:MAG: DUF2794 domain-containing protein [Alphaproteobacteria bacterium]|nr:DUF2794 domain-containing protein [Alphaproteobacteria bacterium]